MRFAPVTYSPVVKMGLYAGFCDLAFNSGKPSRPLNPAVGDTLLLSTVILNRAKPFNLCTSWEFSGSILGFCDKFWELLDPVEKVLFFPTVGIKKMGSIGFTHHDHRSVRVSHRWRATGCPLPDSGGNKCPVNCGGAARRFQLV